MCATAWPTSPHRSSASASTETPSRPDPPRCLRWLVAAFPPQGQRRHRSRLRPPRRCPPRSRHLPPAPRPPRTTIPTPHRNSSSPSANASAHSPAPARNACRLIPETAPVAASRLDQSHRQSHRPNTASPPLSLRSAYVSKKISSLSVATSNPSKSSPAKRPGPIGWINLTQPATKSFGTKAPSLTCSAR